MLRCSNCIEVVLRFAARADEMLLVRLPDVAKPTTSEAGYVTVWLICTGLAAGVGGLACEWNDYAMVTPRGPGTRNDLLLATAGPERRARAIAVTYAEDIVFHDPDGSVTGRPALDAKAQGLLDRAPGFVFAPRGPTYTSAGTLGALAWRFGPADGDPVATGMDIALIKDGLIHTVHTVVDD